MILTAKKNKISSSPARELIRDVFEIGDGVIMGGCARWALVDHQCIASPYTVFPYNDIDIFCSEDQTDQYIKKLSKYYFDSDKFDSIYLDDVASLVTLYSTNVGTNIQLISMKSPMKWHDMIETFDFTVCKAVLVSPSEGYFDTTGYEDHMENRLRINRFGSKTLLGRFIKYMRKGYIPDWDTFVKVLSTTDEKQYVFLSSPLKSLDFYPLIKGVAFGLLNSEQYRYFLQINYDSNVNYHDRSLEF